MTVILKEFEVESEIAEIEWMIEDNKPEIEEMMWDDMTWLDLLTIVQDFATPNLVVRAREAQFTPLTLRKMYDEAEVPAWTFEPIYDKGGTLSCYTITLQSSLLQVAVRDGRTLKAISVSCSPYDPDLSMASPDGLTMKSAQEQWWHMEYKISDLYMRLLHGLGSPPSIQARKPIAMTYYEIFETAADGPPNQKETLLNYLTDMELLETCPWLERFHPFGIGFRLQIEADLFKLTIKEI